MIIEECVFNGLVATYLNESYKYKINRHEFPKELFKFRLWKDDIKNNYDDSVLENLYLHFASPNTFEDRDDCKNRVNYLETCFDEKICVRFRLKILIEKLFRQNRISYKNFLSEINQNPLNELTGFTSVIELKESDWSEYTNFTGILSMAKNPYRREMWQEYTNFFRGICYGFYTESLIRCMNIEKDYSKINHVNYFEELSKISVLENNDLKIYDRKFSKHNKYDFEEEFRITITETNLGKEQRNKHFDINSISRVILGYNMSKKNFDKFIYTLDKQNGNNIPIFVAKLDGEEVIFELLANRTYWN